MGGKNTCLGRFVSALIQYRLLGISIISLIGAKYFDPTSDSTVCPDRSGRDVGVVYVFEQLTQTTAQEEKHMR